MKWKCINKDCSEYDIVKTVSEDKISVDNVTGNIIHSAATCDTCKTTDREEIRNNEPIGKVYMRSNNIPKN